MSELSLFSVKFENDRRDLLINYPTKSLGYKDLVKFREDFKNPSLNYIERDSVKLNTYTLYVPANQAANLDIFQYTGFLTCRVYSKFPFLFNKYLSFTYELRQNNSYLKERAFINDKLLLSDWIKLGCPCEEQSILKMMIME